MENLRKFGIAALAGLVGVATVATFTAPDAKGFMNPPLARMIFWHLPNAITCAIFLLAAAFTSFMYLRTKDEAWDIRANATNEIAVLTGIQTLLTGMLFSKNQWGDYWNWDPRQTSFLFAMLFVAAYFALRAAFDDPVKRASNCAAYNVAAILPLMFLIFVFPRLPMVVSLHPNLLQKGSGLDPTYLAIFVSLLLLYLAVCVILYRLRVRAGLAELALDKSYARLANSDHPAAPRVVRPVPVSQSDRQEGP